MHSQDDWTPPTFTAVTANFLGKLSVADRSEIEGHLAPLSVTRGQLLRGEADASDYVYFPQGPLISLEAIDGVEVGLVGSEGLVGWPALVGCRGLPYRAMVRGRDGTVLRIRTEVLGALSLAIPSIGLAVNRFVNVISVQMAETIGAFALNRVDMRLARWLLLRHDRVGGNVIDVRHDEIASNLRTRRASVTDCLHIIEGDGLIRCRRGRIFIRDRTALEALAADCYGAAESTYREIIGMFGKSAPALTAQPSIALIEATTSPDPRTPELRLHLSRNGPAHPSCRAGFHPRRAAGDC